MNKYYKKLFEKEKAKALTPIDKILVHDLVVFVDDVDAEESQEITTTFKRLKFKYVIFDIADKPRVGKWIKILSKWEVFPQVYVQKKFIGDLDFLTR